MADDSKGIMPAHESLLGILKEEDISPDDFLLTLVMLTTTEIPVGKQNELIEEIRRVKEDMIDRIHTAVEVTCEKLFCENNNHKNQLPLITEDDLVDHPDEVEK